MTVTFDTQAEWEAGAILLNIDTTTVPNHLKAEFASTAAGAASGWIQNSEIANWSVDSRTSVAMGGIGSAWLTMTKTVVPIVGLQTWRTNTTGSGRWEARATIPGSSGVWTFMFMAQSLNASTLFPAGSLPGNTASDYYALYNGYCLRVDSTQGFPTAIRCQLQRMDGNATLNTTIGSNTYPNVGEQEHTFTIVRYPTGLFKVFMDGSGTPFITATDSTYTTGSYLGFASYQSAFVAKNVPGLTKPSTSFQAGWQSSSIDTNTDFRLWRNRLYVYSGSTVYQLGSPSGLQLQTATDTTPGGGSFIFNTPVRANQSPSPAGGQLQYMRVNIFFPTITQANNEDPDVTRLDVGFPLKNTAFLA